MICPKCGMKMNKAEYCFHCGYMTNGNIIDTKKNIEPTILEIYFGNHYDKYIRNKNWIVAGLLGPTYIFCHGFNIVGLMLIIIDSLVSLFFIIFNHALIFYYVVLLFNFIYWFINRLLWSAIGNIIYLKLLTRRLEKIERKNSNAFRKKIPNLFKKDNRFIILKYCFFGLLFLIIFNFVKLFLYSKLGFQ